MSRSEFTLSDLEAYLDEALPVDEMGRVEEALRADPALLARVAEINRRRDAGTHSIGEIWRKHRLSCPPREQLGSYLLDVLDSQTANYIYFHVTEIGCRLCQANLADLREQQEQAAKEVTQRRTRYFQSSLGYLAREK
jgi:anti-sigma factor RsiW